MPATIHVIADFSDESELHHATGAAIAHAADALQTQVDYHWFAPIDLEDPAHLAVLRGSDGLLIGPGSPYSSMKGALSAIRLGREDGIPVLGTCGGFQHALLEYARHVLQLEDAHHAEYDPYASRLFISKLDCSLVGRTLTINLDPSSRTARSYGCLQAEEQYYCNFGVDPAYIPLLRRSDLSIVGSDMEGEVRIVELAEHPFFVATLFVPQARSEAGNPHPLVRSFVAAAVTRSRRSQ